MIWGAMTSGWLSSVLESAEDRYRAELEFLASHDLQACQWGLRALMEMEPGRREELAGWLEEFDVRAVLTFHFDYFAADLDGIRRRVDQTIEGIETLHEMMKTPIVTTAAGTRHRFMREPSLAEQMDRLEAALRPIAAVAHDAGCPVGIENHGDYYCSDLAELCRSTPHLGIFLDTGNTYLIGERPLPAVHAAAPYTVGTHFKDHYVRPNKKARPLCFELQGAVIGSGDVGMREAYRLLVEKAPEPDKLAMILEIDPVEGMGPVQALRASLEFVRSL